MRSSHHAVLERSGSLRARAALVILLAIALLSPGCVKRGVRVTVINAGTAPMFDARIVVTGSTYLLGDLQPSGRASVRARPTGESNVIVRYTDAADQTRDVVVDCYLEPGLTGVMEIEIANGAIRHVNQNTKVGWF